MLISYTSQGGGPINTIFFVGGRGGEGGSGLPSTRVYKGEGRGEVSQNQRIFFRGFFF